MKRMPRTKKWKRMPHQRNGRECHTKEMEENATPKKWKRMPHQEKEMEANATPKKWKRTPHQRNGRACHTKEMEHNATPNDTQQKEEHVINESLRPQSFRPPPFGPHKQNWPKWDWERTSAEVEIGLRRTHSVSCSGYMSAPKFTGKQLSSAPESVSMSTDSPSRTFGAPMEQIFSSAPVGSRVTSLTLPTSK